MSLYYIILRAVTFELLENLFTIKNNYVAITGEENSDDDDD